MNLGGGELRPTSFAGSTEETRKKHRNSRVVPEELGVWLRGAGAGASALCRFYPIPHPKVLAGPHKTLTGDWREEIMSRSENLS